MKLLIPIIVIAVLGCSSDRQKVESNCNGDDKSITTTVIPNAEVGNNNGDDWSRQNNEDMENHKPNKDGNIKEESPGETVDRLQSKISIDAQKAFGDLEQLIDKELEKSKEQ